MKLFLIALSLYSIINACYAAAPCASLPPGLEKLRHGIDLVTFDMFPEDVTAEPGLAGTIFDFTCDEKKKWANPAIPANQYDLPDQIESITHLPGGIMDSRAIVMSSYNDRQKSHSNNVGLTLGGIGGFGFSVGVKAGKLMQKIIGQDRTVTTVTGHLSAYSVEMKPFWGEKMGESMKGFLDTQAPNNYMDNPGKWQEFLSLFGTHYFSTARFGGVFHLEVDTAKGYTESHTEKDLSLQAGISYQSFISINGSHTVGKNATDKAFRDASNEKAYYYGGNADLVNAGPNGFQQWWNSAQANPWLFGGVLEPMINFIPNGPKKNAIQTAIDVKLDYAALDQMLTELGILKQNPYIDMATANSFVAQVNAERAKPIPPHARVLQLSAAIEPFIKVQKSKKAPVVKPVCQVVYDKKLKKNVCVNPTTCTCNVH
jgi:hypothetical protein